MDLSLGGLRVFLSACAVLCACVLAEEKPLKLTYTETSMGKLSTGARPDMMIFSANGQRVAWPIKRSDGWCVQLDGKETRLVEWLLPHTLAFSPDSAHFAYVAQNGDRMYMVVDDVDGKPFKEVSRIVFARNGKRSAYIATRDDGTQAIVLDGQEGQPYPRIHLRSLFFSPDGTRFAFVVEQAGQKRWIIDGREGPAYEFVGPIVFSADGKRWGHVADHGGRQCVVIDGVEQPFYDQVGGFSFSPDGQRFGYAASRSRRFMAIIDGKEGKEYDFVGAPFFSPDSKRVVYEANRGKRWMVVLDGEEQRTYDRVSSPTFNEKGDRMIYWAKVEKKEVLVLDGQETAEYDRIGNFVLSADGTRLAFAAKKEIEDYLVLDGKELPGAGYITMSPDGKYVAHSRDTAFGSLVMVNATEGKQYDGFLKGSRWVFTSPDRFVLMAGKGGEVLKVEVQISEQ